MSALVELLESERWVYHEIGIVWCLLSGSEFSCHIWGPVTTYQHTGRIAQCRATRPQSMGQFVVLMVTCTRTRVRWNCWLVGECSSLTAQPRDTNYWTVSPIHLHSTKIKRNVHTAWPFLLISYARHQHNGNTVKHATTNLFLNDILFRTGHMFTSKRVKPLVLSFCVLYMYKGPGDRVPLVLRFSAPFKIDREAHPAPYTMVHSRG
jgi:hypothetical protein